MKSGKRASYLPKKKRQALQLASLFLAAVVCVFLVLGHYFYRHHLASSLASWPTSIPQLQSLFKEIYGPFTGYYLTEQEKQKISEQGGDYSYGEITLESSMTLLFDVFRAGSKDVLYDLGSGIGKFVLQSYFFSNVSKVVGIELSPRRSSLATRALEGLVQRSIIHPLALDAARRATHRHVSLVEGNFLEHDLSDATLVYMCATCFSDELLDRVHDKLKAEARPGLLILTLAEFPSVDPLHFRHIDSVTLSMSWSSDSTGYLYEKI